MWEEIRDADAAQLRLQGRITPGGVWHDLSSRSAIVEKHYNSVDSAHRIIRLMIERVKQMGTLEPLLHTDLRGHEGRVVRGASAGKELERQLEESIRQIQQDLRIHDAKCLPKEERRTEAQRQVYKTWRDERRVLQERLETRQRHLKQLSSITVSTLPIFPIPARRAT